MTPILDLAHATGCTWQLIDGKLRVSGTKTQRDAFRPLAGQVVALEIKRQGDALANAFAWHNRPAAIDGLDYLMPEGWDKLAAEVDAEAAYLVEERRCIQAEAGGQ